MPALSPSQSHIFRTSYGTTWLAIQRMLITETLYRLISLLADGRFHTGPELGRHLGITRAAVWKALHQLPQMGLVLHAVSGRGYRLAEPVELLSVSNITQLLAAGKGSAPLRVQLFPVIDSTSDYLKEAADRGAASGSVCLSEYQTHGRGRRGRQWHSPFGSNIYLSVLWRFNAGMIRLGALSLAVAVALIRGFNEIGCEELGIKWPNDIVGEMGKLAGILVDVAGESGGPCHAVIGIGINYSMQRGEIDAIDQPWMQLRDFGVTLGRNAVVAVILRHLSEVLSVYEQQGFDPLRAEWAARDVLCDQEVNVVMPNSSCNGIARGIDPSGMLLVEHQGDMRRYAAGEVSLRRTQKK